MRRLITCLAAALMVCSVASGAGYTWSYGGVDRDFMNTGNWSPIPGAIAAGDDMWIHENGAIGSMATSSPYLATDTGVKLNWVVLGFADSLGSGRLDIDAGGNLRVAQVVMGWGGTNPNNSTSILSLNGASSTLTADIVQVGNGGIDGQVINNGGTWNGLKLWVGGHPSTPGTGTSQVDLLAGDTWLGIDEADTLAIAAGQNVNLESGRLMLLGDRTALITSLLDGRLTGYGSSANIQMDTTTFGGWTTVTAIPEPATFSLVAMLGGGLLWIRKRLTI